MNCYSCVYCEVRDCLAYCRKLNCSIPPLVASCGQCIHAVKKED